MKLASHNSWTYLKPKTILQKLIAFTAKCQEVDIYKQYNKYNVRGFDLRIRLNDDNKVTICHNLVEYKNSSNILKSTLSYLNDKRDTNVRVMLECRNKIQDTQKQRDWFIKYCRHLEEAYPNIRFYGGTITGESTILYNFGHYVDVEGNYSSWPKKSNPLVGLYPYKYAKKHNKDIINKGSTHEYLMIDFANIQ